MAPGDDARGELVEAGFGVWKVLEHLIEKAEDTPDFAENPSHQTDLMYQIGNLKSGYWHLSEPRKQELLSRIIPLVPRVRDAKEPKATLEMMLQMWIGPNPFEDIARSLYVVEDRPKVRVWTEEDKMYLTGGFLEDVVHYAAQSDCPVGYIWWGGVVALASALKFNHYVDRNSDFIRLGTLYAAFIADRGTLKSVGLQVASDILHHMNHQLHPWAPGGKAPDFRRVCPFGVKMLPQDTNWRTLVGCLASQPAMLSEWLNPQQIDRDMSALTNAEGQFFPTESGTLILDELSVLFARDNFAVDKVTAGLNAIFNGRPFTYQTQSGGTIILKQPSLVMAGNAPPDTMRDVITPTLVGGGIMDRMVVVYKEDRSKDYQFPKPFPRDPLIAAELARQLLPYTRRVRPLQIVAKPDAEAWLDAWFFEARGTRPGGVSLARRTNRMWQMGAYIGISRGHDPFILLDDFETAHRILTLEDRGLEMFNTVVQRDSAADLMDHIMWVAYDGGAPEPGVMMQSDLYRKLAYRKGLSPPALKAKPYLDSLNQQGDLLRKTGVRRGNTGALGTGYQIPKAVAEQMRLKRERKKPSGPPA